MMSSEAEPERCTYEHWGITQTIPCMMARPYESYRQELLYPWHVWGVTAIVLTVGALLAWMYTSRSRHYSTGDFS